MSNIKNLFQGLDKIGFNNTENISIYKKATIKKTETKKTANKIIDPSTLLFDRTIDCPVCHTNFKTPSVKKEGYKIDKRDSDSFIYYKDINPYLYDIILCPKCGYAALKNDFSKLRNYQRIHVIKNITPKYISKEYPRLLDINSAIERYKLALLNSVYIDSTASTKAILCLRLGWLYRLTKSYDNENLFLSKAVEGLEFAYTNESFPIYGMDSYSLEYLIGELYRRIGNFDASLKWFSSLIVKTGVDPKLKEKSRCQRDLAKNSIKK